VGVVAASDQKDNTSARQETAALRNFGPANDSFGSKATIPSV
jgi:hypothetical protein